MKWDQWLAVLSLIALILFVAFIGRPTPVRGQPIWPDANGNSVMTGHPATATQPRVVYPTYYKQTADGSIVETKAQPLVAKEKDAFIADIVWWFIVLGSSGAVLLFCTVMFLTFKQRKGESHGHGKAVRYTRKIKETGLHHADGLSAVLEQLRLSESTGWPDGGIGRPRYAEHLRPVSARHSVHSALGSWAQHLRIAEAEREVHRYNLPNGGH